MTPGPATGDVTPPPGQPGGTVTVRGTAVVPATPDEVRLAVSVEATEKSPEKAQAECARRSDALDQVFDQLRIEASRRATQGLTVQEQREYEHNRWVSKGFTATNRVLLRLDDPEPIGQLLRDATGAAQARVEGPWWWVALDNPARTQACAEAASEARRKAEAYATALGVELGPPVRVVEPGLTHRLEVDSMPAPAAMMRAGGAGGTPQPVVTVEAADLDVQAAVEVTFTLR
jgi:uncharacterized protein